MNILYYSKPRVSDHRRCTIPVSLPPSPLPQITYSHMTHARRGSRDRLEVTRFPPKPLVTGGGGVLDSVIMKRFKNSPVVAIIPPVLPGLVTIIAQRGKSSSCQIQYHQK